MDDFYKECSDKLKDSNDPAGTIDELLGISIHGLPRVQLCKFAEQATTLLSVIFQITNDSSQDLTISFQM